MLAEGDGDEEEGKGCCLFACSPKEFRLRRMDGRTAEAKKVGLRKGDTN